MIAGTETVIIVRKTFGTDDDYGIPAETTTQTTVAGCLLGFGSTDEPSQVDASPQSSQVTVYFPEGTVIEPSDSFIIRGEPWVKDGRQMDWLSPFQGHHVGVVVNVRQERG